MEQLDLSILYFFNQTIASPTLDAAVIFLTNVRNWVPVYALASIFLVWRHKWYGLRMVIAVALLAGLADASANLYIKGLFARPRPCSPDMSGIAHVPWIRLPDGCRGGFGLPSSHAVNNFAAATFFVMLFPSLRPALILFLVASVIAITRLYLGLHYPSDIFAGALFGSLLGYGFSNVFLFVEKRCFSKPKSSG